MIGDWPESIVDAVQRVVGPMPDVTPAGGMSGANVFRLRGHDSSVILKRSDNPREWFVYSRLAHVFSQQAIAIPELYAHAESGDAWWVLIEDVPHPIPAERWPADDAIAMLRRLHSLPVALLDEMPEPYGPAWTPDLNLHALSLFVLQDRDNLGAQLEGIRQRSSHLFDPSSIISGDPNPANWGRRVNGTPVLFDWERCTLASPAIDLGIIVPGLGSQAAFESVSHAYSGNLDLAPDIAAAKLWSVTEFLAGYAAGEITPAFDIAALIDRVPAWIEEEISPLAADRR
jgi:hypothetical protein